jgi:hypothetical protein
MTKEEINDLAILIKNLKNSKCIKTSLEQDLMDKCEKLILKLEQTEQEIARLRRSI